MTDTERKLEELIEKYTPLIKAYVKRYTTTDYHDMQDAYQYICMKLWQHIPRRYDPNKGSLFFYFRRRVLQEAINYRKRRLKNKPIGSILGERCECADSLFDLDKLVLLADTSCRKRIIEMALEGYNVTEMAEVLKTSRAAIDREFRYFRTLYKED